MDDKEFARMLKRSIDHLNFCLEEARKRKIELHIDFNRDRESFSVCYRYLTQDDTLKITDFYIPVPNIDLL